jgi:regulator of Ty1 transposition protein 109
MAAHDGLTSGGKDLRKSLEQLLAEALPKDTSFKVYHLSTPPTSTSALYSAPPGKKPDKTYCENHFLSVSINPNGKAGSEVTGEVLVYAIEILIYSTSHSTTLFVSKADSSGYLHLLNLPKGSPSPLKEISSAFLSYLVERRRRPGIQTIVSLFARAQDQYLFARSIHNKGKHVLDDRGLVKWWCRVLIPLLANEKEGAWHDIHGYLTVPGLDTYEAKAFLPAKSTETKAWTVGHPLREIALYSDAPPRCLIPHFPDDPKSRFLDELDEELSGSQGKENGQWKSVKDLDTFWEMMAFRQECSAGRLVGFIWVVFSPVSPSESEGTTSGQALDSQTSLTSGSKALDSQTTATSSFTETDDGSLGSPRVSGQPSRTERQKAKKQPLLTGPIVPRKPRVKANNRSRRSSKPERSPYYTWPADSRGQVVFEEKDYNRFHELLLCLDFANLDLACEATKRWTSEVLDGSPVETHGWGTPVVGTRSFEARNLPGRDVVTTLNLGLVRKKRRAGDDERAPVETSSETRVEAAEVNVLGAGMVRKKAKP